MTKLEIVKLFDGNDSKLWQTFHDKLNWSHTKFLQFINTYDKLSEFNFTTKHAYSIDEMMDDMMEKLEFI